MKKILISGYIGFENFGDEALLYVLVNDLINLGVTKENITVISNNKAAITNIYNLKAINRWNLFEIINELVTHDALVFIGGLFQDKTSINSFFYYYLQFLLAKLFGKEILFYGTGIGPLNRKITKILFKFCIGSCKFITVRDKESAYSTPNIIQAVQVTCDPVWALEVDYSVKKQIPKVNWSLPIIAVSMRNDKNLKKYFFTNFAEKLSRVITDMKDWQITLIPCMPNEDLPILSELQDLIGRRTGTQDRITLIENFTKFPITQQAGILASCDVIIGMRYHALLIPLAHGKPAFGLIYDTKIKSLLNFASQIGASPRDDFDQAWSYFWQNLQNLSEFAKQATERAKELHKKNTNLLERLVKNA